MWWARACAILHKSWRLFGLKLPLPRKRLHLKFHNISFDGFLVLVYETLNNDSTTYSSSIIIVLYYLLWYGFGTRLYFLLLLLLYPGAHNSERATSLCPCNGISRGQYIFRSSFLQILTISQHKPETWK